MPKSSLLFVFIFLIISCSKDSDQKKEEPDVIAPVVEFSIAGTPNNTTGEPIVVSNQIEVNVNAQDQGGISKIEAFINNTLVGEDSSPPFSIIINVSSYTSKVTSTNKYEDYILKVTATDLAGNTSSVEQNINIDNELPTISEVSLIDNSVLNGDTNNVTFEVMDNEEITSVMVYLNEELLSDITEDSSFEFNIDTSSLLDGENTLKIEVKDPAENTGIHIVSFIVDNTGPEITIEAITNGQIIYELTDLIPLVSDLYSNVVSFEILNGETNLASFDKLATTYEFTFDPDIYPTGINTLLFKATDILGNESSIEIPIEIYRKLVTINLPTDFYNPQIARIYVFASSTDGQVLDTKRIFQNTQQVVLSTQYDINLEEEFSITFGEYVTGQFGNSSELTSIQDLKYKAITEFNLKTYPRIQYGLSRSFSKTNFDPDDQISLIAQGFGYNNSYSEPNELVLEQATSITSGIINPEKMYISLNNMTLNQHSYLIVDWDIPNNFVVNYDNFIQDGMEQKFYQTTLNSGNYESSTLSIYGYLSEMEFQNNVSHRIYDYGYGSMPVGGVPFFFNTNLYETKYSLRVNNYFTERIGVPLETFVDVDWGLDYSYSNKEISLTKSGIGHNVGKISIGTDAPTVINGLNISYRWSTVFDSETSDSVSLPEIPEEMQNWGFYQIFEQDNLEVQQVEIKKYQGIISYEDYINKVIKNNTHSYLVSPSMESRFKNNQDGYYVRYPHFLLD
ncbi:Ig-like domain-containing protein [Maribacter sp. HTCC2170]|uniref:Ig-like domain-containing protein n=1 Tax=Maribacter sp. (strain HTCC2170 / KCCM 42371) TaxID=313603 RepID=UPI00006B48E0|nr:Ig-like domain-containing protein [Maribacter sp. HTCC2170]EAR00901.1 fibronectin type III domain protein [Maribacter sp. HTCC2170]